MTIRFETPEFHASVAEVRRTAAELADARARASGEVGLLLGDWHGAAATAFAEAWEQWLAASRSVAESLEALADGLGTFQTDVVERDAASSQALDRLAGRVS